ncbi:MAG TPA: hypothetical protein VFF78_07960, partial [Anaerolineaceae bacterium]|nr:hypothetical protein [Anaerolineaceae bacterium]
MIRLLSLLILLLNNLLFPNAASLALHHAPIDAAALEIKDLQVSYEFGLKVNFQAWLSPAEEVQEVYLMIQPLGNSTRVENIQPASDGHILFEYDLSARPLPPFSPVEYWLRVTTKDGKQMESLHQTFLYEDNRFEWQVIETDSIVVKWYAGDLSFGQTVMDAATAGVEKARELVNADPPQPLRIYVYPAPADLQAALALINASWVAGHASPEFATVLV